VVRQRTSNKSLKSTGQVSGNTFEARTVQDRSGNTFKARTVQDRSGNTFKAFRLPRSLIVEPAVPEFVYVFPQVLQQ
jgi:hypothetical protein